MDRMLNFIIFIVSTLHYITYFLNFWYINYANIEISFSGEVASLTGSELNSLLLSGGADGKTCIYDLNRRILVNHLQYGSSVTCLRWLPLEVSYISYLIHLLLSNIGNTFLLNFNFMMIFSWIPVEFKFY